MLKKAKPSQFDDLFSKSTFIPFFKNYLEPWMLKQQREDPLKESLDKLANSVSGLEETLSRQKTLLEELVQRSYAVEDQANWKNESAEIKSEIISLKGLFLSRYLIPYVAQFSKITGNVSFEFLNSGIFHQFLFYQK